MKYKIGMVLSGTITGLQPYGAFVSLDEETQGLIHVSEVQAGFTKNIHGLLTVGQKLMLMNILKRLAYLYGPLKTKFIQ